MGCVKNVLKKVNMIVTNMKYKIYKVTYKNRTCYTRAIDAFAVDNILTQCGVGQNKKVIRAPGFSKVALDIVQCSRFLRGLDYFNGKCWMDNKGEKCSII